MTNNFYYLMNWSIITHHSTNDKTLLHITSSKESYLDYNQMDQQKVAAS